VLIDLAVNPFDADVGEMVAMAVAAERAGYSAVWVADHFSGAVVDRRWSRDAFVCLGAMAASTTSIDLGLLVANMRNRHPAQLASAVNSLQSLAPGRIRLGIGSGAVPDSRFAVEHEAIGTDLGTVTERRAMLTDSIRALRAIWAGERSVDTSSDVGYVAMEGIVDGAPCPPIVVGASAWPTIELALDAADGVNVRRSGRLPEVLDRINALRGDMFEVSVLDAYDDVVADPVRVADMADSGVDRLVLGISMPLHISRLAALRLG